MSVNSIPDKLRKSLLVGLAVNWIAVILIAILWVLSEFRRVEFVVNDWQAHFLYFEFNAVGGEFYLGCPIVGIHLNLPFFLVVVVLLIWPVVDMVVRIRRSRKRRGFDVGRAES